MRLRGAAIAIAVIASPAPARAEDCAPPNILHKFPDDGATGVPTNAILLAQYAPSAQYVGDDKEAVTFRGPDPGGSEIPIDPFFGGSCSTSVSPDDGGLPPGNVCYSDKESLLKLLPPGDLEPGGAYTVQWPGLRGLTAGRGGGAKITFTVGDGPDSQAPFFEGLEKIEWDVDRERDDCTDSEQDRPYFDLTPGSVDDDFGRDLLKLVIYQTHGPNISVADEPVPVAAVPLPEPGKPVRIERSIDNANGPVCFAAHVEDLAGNASGGSTEVCTTTIRPPFFYGCGVPPASAQRIGAWPLSLLLLLAARRRHRSLS